jgi:plasmid stabilization system protein ParE
VTIYFSPEAERDFAAVIGYLAERNPRAAAELGQRIFALIDKLVAGEFEGPEHVLTSGERVHSWAVPPVRIYYQRPQGAFWVVRIYHQALPPITR